MNRERPTQPTHLARAPEDTLLAEIRSRTPARLFAGRAGASYRTQTLLELREDHAAALDAVQDQLDLRRDLGEELVKQFGLVEVATKAASKLEYLRRPDLGLQLEQQIQHVSPPRTRLAGGPAALFNADLILPRKSP